MILGIDISVHNGNVNVKKVKEDGYQYIIIRSGYGQNNIDQKFTPNAQACINLDMPMGVYWFSYAYTVEMAKQEALYAIEAVKKYKAKCPIAYDLEYDSVRYARTKGVEITKSLATSMAKAFLSEVEKAGYIPVLYTNSDYEKNYFDMKQFIGIHKWYAHYKDAISTTEKERASIWQKSSTGKVRGITGNVDINEFYVDFKQLEATEKEKQKVTCNINILNFQKAANADGYRDQNGKALIEDGIDGSKTQYVRKQIVLKAFKISTGFKVGSTGNVVEWWQTRLNELGFITVIDSKYGKDTREKTRLMQKKYNLKKDGVAGYNSISTAFYV
ncbi:GH25 family lysozyme [Konateibacter massiliensis]|uniref:GH25 family lysozyme n=1 Tax=Konateibacter massiliensis TaxID=2002841 RepID=UPI000C159BC7|nr:GH25 family lysozyme [Konateibacter massiliensis]